MLARSCLSVRTGEDEREARRCMSPRLPTFAKNKGAKVGRPALVSKDQKKSGQRSLALPVSLVTKIARPSAAWKVNRPTINTAT